MAVKALVRSMRLRTLPLSLAGVVCGSLLALPAEPSWQVRWATLLFLYLTTVGLQILSNLSNEMGDHLSGVDGEGREGPNYSMTDGGLTVRQMWKAINAMVVVCCLSGFVMVVASFGTLLHSWQAWLVLVLGAAAIWAATHYTLGKRPYGYRGLGDLFVFIFFGLVSVLGSYYIVAHALAWDAVAPAVGCGLLSVGVLNVNNIRDMSSDEGLRKTIPLRIGQQPAKVYQTLLVAGGYLCYLFSHPHWVLALLALPFAVHLAGVWKRQGKALDPMLPLLVLSTFVLSLLYTLV